MNPAAPFFSVIIPSYNRQKEVIKAIQSVIKQEFRDFEILLIDDGSTDNTMVSIAKAFDDNRLKPRSIPHSGRSAARNKGLEMASGEWICFLDSDDEYLPGVLQTRYMKCLAFPAFRAFACEQVIGNQPRPYAQPHHREDQVEFTFSDFLIDNPLSLNQLCFKRESHGGTFPKILDYAEDWFFFRELSFSYNILKHNYNGIKMSDHDGRSMNTVQVEKLARDNYTSAMLTCETLPLATRVKEQLSIYTGLLCANIVLSGKGSKKVAWSYFKSALSFKALTYTNFYKALIKFAFIG